MSFIHSLRNKPKRVRERIVFLAVLIAAPILLIIWSITANYGKSGTGTNTADTFKSAISGTFNNPVYQNTFGTPKQ